MSLLGELGVGDKTVRKIINTRNTSIFLPT